MFTVYARSLNSSPEPEDRALLRQDLALHTPVPSTVAEATHNLVGENLGDAAAVGAMVSRFLQWIETASASERARGGRSLALAYLGAPMGSDGQEELLLGLTVLLDDVSPLVRRALAEALATSPDAPHEVVTALAHDQSDVSTPVLSLSPVLTDAELVDAVALGDSAAQTAVARRAFVALGVAAAIAEVGSAEACTVLCRNRRAELTAAVLARLIARHGRYAELRDAALARPELDAAAHHDLVEATAGALTEFVAACGWMSAATAQRTARDATDQASILIAADTENRMGPPGTQALVAHLLRCSRLTPALILRAALCGERAFVEAAFSQLSGLPLSRVAGFVRNGRAVGFGALYAKVGLPAALLPAFVAVLVDPVPRRAGDSDQGPRLRRDRIARALDALGAASNQDAARVCALLRRLDAEAAREAARRVVLPSKAEAPLPVSLLPRLSRAEHALLLRPAA